MLPKNRQHMFLLQQDSCEFQEVYSGVPNCLVLDALLSLLFINDVSNFTTDGAV